jgi:hypothetical protein
MTKSSLLLVLIALTAVAVLLGVQEYRFQSKLDALRAERASASGAPADTATEEAREAVRQMGRAREELAAAQQRLTRAAQQIQQLQEQIQALAQAGPLGGRRLREPAIAEMGFLQPPPLDPSQPPRRSWGQEQATGAPDTSGAGDIPTAWAPREQDGGEEWLHLDYSNQVQIAEVRVRETYNPGAISKVAAVLPSGQEVVIWEGVDEPGVAPVDKSFAVPAGITAGSVKVYLDTKRVPGWNEIDAVELVGRDGSRQWAAHARASSSFADPR